MRAECFLLMLVVGVLAPAVSGGLLVNGDAESGDFSGWSVSGDNILQNVTTRKQSTGWVTPAEGERFFSFARIQGDYAKMSQSGLVGDAEGMLMLSGMFQGEYDDAGTVTLSVYDKAGNELVSATTGEMTTDILVWEDFEIECVLPDGSHSWEVVLEGELKYGSYVNVFYDGLMLVPEPATILLFGFGVVLLNKSKGR